MLNTDDFGNQVDLKKEYKCPLCSGIINLLHFQNELAVEEFMTSGLCQSCQDDVFGGNHE